MKNKETRAASVPSDLVLCRRIVKPSTHEGDTGYEYFEPVQDYVPSDKERAEAFVAITAFDIAMIEESCDFTDLAEHMGKIYAHIEVIKRALTAPDQSELIDKLVEASDDLGQWLSAGLDDPQVCAEMKTAINKWFEALALAEKARGA